MFTTRLAKSAGIVSRLRNPPITTRSTPRLRHCVENLAAEGVLIGKAFLLDDQRGNIRLFGESQSAGLRIAGNRPAKSSTVSRPASIFSSRFFSVVPPPEISTAILKAFCRHGYYEQEVAGK